MELKPKRVILVQEGCYKKRDECGCFKRFRRCKIIKKIIKFIRWLICSLKTRSRETLIFGDSSDCNTQVKNILTMPKFICPGEEFTIDLETIVQVCCGLDSSGRITVSLLDGQLTGPAEIIDFTTGAVSGCSNGCPNGSVSGLIDPSGKQIFLLFDDFSVEATGNIPGQSKVKKCCKTRIHLLANESNEEKIIMFESTIGGDADLDADCGGPFIGPFESTVIIEAKFVDSNHPCCREKQKKCKCQNYVYCKHVKSRCKKKNPF